MNRTTGNFVFQNYLLKVMQFKMNMYLIRSLLRLLLVRFAFSSIRFGDGNQFALLTLVQFWSSFGCSRADHWIDHNYFMHTSKL